MGIISMGLIHLIQQIQILDVGYNIPVNIYIWDIQFQVMWIDSNSTTNSNSNSGTSSSKTRRLSTHVMGQLNRWDRLSSVQGVRPKSFHMQGISNPTSTSLTLGCSFLIEIYSNWTDPVYTQQFTSDQVIHVLNQQATVIQEVLHQQPDQSSNNHDLGLVLLGALRQLPNTERLVVEVGSVSTAALGVRSQGVEVSTPPIIGQTTASQSVSWTPLSGYYWYMVNRSATSIPLSYGDGNTVNDDGMSLTHQLEHIVRYIERRQWLLGLVIVGAVLVVVCICICFYCVLCKGNREQGPRFAMDYPEFELVRNHGMSNSQHGKYHAIQSNTLPSDLDMEYEDEDVELGHGIAMNPVRTAAGNSRLIGLRKDPYHSVGHQKYVSVSTDPHMGMSGGISEDDSMLDTLDDTNTSTNPLVSVKELAFSTSYRSNDV